MRENIMQGETMSDAMRNQRGFFPQLLIAMTRVGEATGKVERTFLSLADHYEQQLKLRRAFLSSIAWPALQLFGGIVVISILILIMGMINSPTGGPMTDMLGFNLRGPSGVLWFWAYVAIFFSVVGSFVWAFFRNVGGLQNLIPLLYAIPVAGPAIQTITLSRFSWTLSIALEAGLDPIRSVSLALDSTASAYYQIGASKVEKAILGGETLAGALRATAIFPEDYLSFIEIAELSGTDAESIDRLAQQYDERAKMAMKTIAGLASGLIWLFVVGVMIFLIIRLVMNIAGVYSEALQPI
jgi:type II secretory pathway component PulF